MILVSAPLLVQTTVGHFPERSRELAAFGLKYPFG